MVENQGTPYRYDLQKNGDPDIYTEDIYLKYVNSDGVLMGGAPLFTYSRTGMSVSPALSNGIYIVKAANDSETLIRKIVL